MSNWTAEEANNVINKIMVKSATDKNFREKALKNISAVVKEMTGKDLPEGFNVDVIENRKGVMRTIVLPEFAGEDISEEALDAVSGGACKSACFGKGIRIG